MALAYLLDPVFQIENTAGKPASGGWLEVYVAGSREKYYCASDFDGTLHPFRIELDSLGANIVLADDSQSYDVYVYNRYGGLLMSRYNVSPSNGGGGVSLSTITSTDGSIIVTQTANGVDLRVDSEAPSTMRCTATSLLSDDVFDFSELQRDGQNAFVNNGEVVVNEGWWHYDITARLVWPANPAENVESEISLYCVNGSDSISFDRSYEHSETLQLSGEFKSTQDGTAFNVGVSGIPSGMTVDLVDFGIHSIIGNGAGGKYDAGTGIDIDEPNRIISVDFNEVQAKLTAGEGISIDENNVISSTGGEIYIVEYRNGDIPVSEYNEAYAAYQDGKTLFLKVTTSGGYGALCSYSANAGLIFAVPVANHSTGDQGQTVFEESWVQFYAFRPGVEYAFWSTGIKRLVPNPVSGDEGRVLTVNNQTRYLEWTDIPEQLQANWTEADNTSPSYIQNKPTIDQAYDSASTNAQSGTAVAEALATIDTADLFIATYNVTPFADVLAAYNAGKTIFCKYPVTDVDKYLYCKGVGSYNQQIVKFDFFEAGGTTLDNYVYVTDASVSYYDGWSSHSTILNQPVQSDWSQANSANLDYIKNKPAETTLAAGNNITITESGSTLTIAATAAPQVQADWTEADNTSVQYIQNKPANLVQDASYVHTDNNFTNSDVSKLAGIAAGAEVNVQSDWTEADNTADSYIQNKPTPTSLVAGANISIVDDAQNNTVTISAATVNVPVQDVTINNVSVVNAQGVAEIPRQVNADWNSSAGASEILNKPSIPVIGTITL